MNKRILFISLAFLLVSCKKEKLGPQSDVSPINASEITMNTDVYILNEGNFNFGNATITKYATDSKEATPSIYKAVNQSNLGDVAQSVLEVLGSTWIIINNSQKIIQVNKKTFKKEKEINGLTSPRYGKVTSSGAIYITDLYANAIHVLNSEMQKVKEIKVSNWCEQILIHQDVAYLSQPTNNQLLLVNTKNDQIIDSIPTGIQPGKIVIDKNNKLWVLCSGGTSQGIPELLKIDPATNTVVQKFLFDSLNDSPGNLQINNTGSSLYYINSDIYTFDITSTTLPSQPVIKSNGRLFYGFNIHPKNGTLFVSDAIDYVQNGTMFHYDSDHHLIHSFKSGIIPSFVYFPE